MNDADEFDINQIRDAIARRHRPPRDIVLARLTRADVLALNAAAGARAEVLHPGQMTLDIDGNPTGMTPSRTTTEAVAKPIIPRAELDRLGLTQEEVPNVHIIG